MTLNEAHSNLVKVLTQGRIDINGKPLTFIELDALLQSERRLFDGAKELEESKALKNKEPRGEAV